MDLTLHVTPDRSPHRRVVALIGEVDHWSGADLLALPVETDLRIDLSEVTFIDCGGLRQLQALGERCRRHGRAVAFEDPSRPVRRLYELLGGVRVDAG